MLQSYIPPNAAQITIQDFNRIEYHPKPLNFVVPVLYRLNGTGTSFDRFNGYFVFFE